MSPGPWDIRNVGERIAALIQEKNLGKTILAGYSAGGAIALISAISSGGKTAGLLLSNTGLNTQNHGDPDAPKKIKQGFSAEQMSTFIDSCFYYPVPSALKQKMLDYIKNAPPQAAYEGTLSLRQTDLQEEAKTISCPVVIAHGIYDTRRTKEHAERIQKSIPQARIIWLKGGHTIMVDDKQGYMEALNNLIDEMNRS
jgi:pimeloyl-ACP methyl ester carboxylesterase